MSALPDLLAGVYRHYKGPLYLVLGYGRDANQDGRTVVVYVGLELTGSARPGARINVRDVDDFFAVVDPATGTVPDVEDFFTDYPRRFTYVGPEWQQPEPEPVAGAEYRLVRPDGTVLYTEIVADGPTHVAGEHWPPNTPVGTAKWWWLVPDGRVDPPFRWQGRRFGATEWVTLVESDP